MQKQKEQWPKEHAGGASSPVISFKEKITLSTGKKSFSITGLHQTHNLIQFLHESKELSD